MNLAPKQKGKIHSCWTENSGALGKSASAPKWGLRINLVEREGHGMKKHERSVERKGGREGKISRSLKMAGSGCSGQMHLDISHLPPSNLLSHCSVNPECRGSSWLRWGSETGETGFKSPFHHTQAGDLGQDPGGQFPHLHNGDHRSIFCKGPHEDFMRYYSARTQFLAQGKYPMYVK